MRLLADENVSGLVVTILRDAGFDVARLADDERGSRDEVVLLELDQLSKHAEAARVLSVVPSLDTQIEGKLVVVEPSRTRIRPLPGPEP